MSKLSVAIKETCEAHATSANIALKVYVSNSEVHRELPIYNHLNQIHSSHPGRRCLRILLDSFQVAGPHGHHFCLVHPPLGMSLYDLKMRARGKVFSKDVLRTSVRQLLAALDYLHKEAHVIHTGNL
jgi:serine/threonine-protein kinase SRPK3